MHYRRLGRSGLKVSEISLGSWVTIGSQIDEQTSIDLFHAAHDAGVNFFDNADIYANGQAEIVMGKAIQGLPREGDVIRPLGRFGDNGQRFLVRHDRLVIIRIQSRQAQV